MTSDDFFPLLESEADSEFFTRVSSLLAVGGVRGIVVGGVYCEGRWHGRWQNNSPRRLKLPQPLFSSRCRRKQGEALSDRDPEATIMSIDEIGAFDLISRNAMLEACSEWKT